MSAIETSNMTRSPQLIPTPIAGDTLDIRGNVSGAIMTFGGNDIVSLAAGSTVNGNINLGDGADTLNLASTAFGALDAGEGDDTLSISATGLTLDAATVSGFETFAFNTGRNTLSGTHIGLTSSSIATGATLNLANGAALYRKPRQ